MEFFSEEVLRIISKGFAKRISGRIPKNEMLEKYTIELLDESLEKAVAGIANLNPEKVAEKILKNVKAILKKLLGFI